MLTAAPASAQERATPLLERDPCPPPAPDYEPASALVDGCPASAEDWPATLFFEGEPLEGDTRRSACTSTLVGQRVVLTAAHCLVVDAQGIGLGTVQKASGSVVGKVACERHPDYSARDPVGESADFALCELQSDYADARCEAVDVVGADLEIGASVQLLGYGCTRRGFLPRHQLYWGRARVENTPMGDSYFSETGNLSETEKGASLCKGDSGGGAYLDVPGGRRLFAVNSQWNTERRRSLLSTTSAKGSTRSFADWARDWSARNSASICGLD